MHASIIMTLWFHKAKYHLFVCLFFFFFFLREIQPIAVSDDSSLSLDQYIN